MYDPTSLRLHAAVVVFSAPPSGSLPSSLLTVAVEALRDGPQAVAWLHAHGGHRARSARAASVGTTTSATRGKKMNTHTGNDMRSVARPPVAMISCWLRVR